jgi:polyphosphate kinase
VISVVDRFLEHARIYAFGTGEKTEVYLSSADWMPRNFHRRIEVMFPVEEPQLARRILDEILGLGFKDNTRAQQLMVDGTYVPVPLQLDGQTVRSQQVLMDLARRGGEPRPGEPLIRHVASPVEKPGDPPRSTATNP